MKCLSTKIRGEAMGYLMMGTSEFELPGELLDLVHATTRFNKICFT